MSFFKKDKMETKNYADADVQTQLARIIEQLGFLERKIDGLAQNSAPRPGGFSRPGGRPGFSRPGGRPGFGRPSGQFSGGHSSNGHSSSGGGFRSPGGFRGNRDNQHRRPSGGPRSHSAPRPQQSHSQASHPDGSKGENFGNV